MAHSNAEMFQKLVNEVDAHVGVDSSRDGSIGLFHILAAALDWCDAQKPAVDFDLTLEEVRQHFRENNY